MVSPNVVCQYLCDQGKLVYADSQKVLDEPAGEQASDRYVWTTQWYPVRVAEDLHTDRPNAVKLLGKDLVIWRDAQKQWRCFEDACPHRYATVGVCPATTVVVIICQCFLPWLQCP